MTRTCRGAGRGGPGFIPGVRCASCERGSLRVETNSLGMVTPPKRNDYYLLLTLFRLPSQQRVASHTHPLHALNGKDSISEELSTHRKVRWFRSLRLFPIMVPDTCTQRNATRVRWCTVSSPNNASCWSVQHRLSVCESGLEGCYRRG